MSLCCIGFQFCRGVAFGDLLLDVLVDSGRVKANAIAFVSGYMCESPMAGSC